MTSESNRPRVAFMSSARSIPKLYTANSQRIFDLHGGNTGNVAFVNAIASHLTGHVTPVSWGTPPNEIRQAGDVLVIACANQLGAHTDLGKTAANIEGAGLPVLAIGLGAQASSSEDEATITDGTRRWIEVITALRPSKGPNIGVRGAYTVQQLERLGFEDVASVTGCPSNFTNLSFDYTVHLERRMAAPTTFVAGAIGLPFDLRLRSIEREIVNLIDETNGICIVQHGLSMIQLACGEFNVIDPKVMEISREYFCPDLSLAEFRSWCRRRLAVFADADNWMNWLKRYDFVVGPRFHGVMLAIQAGIPGGCISHDSRTLEMCATMGIPARPYESLQEPLTLANLKQQFPFDAEVYRTKRNALRSAYVDLLNSTGVSYDPRLSSTIG